MEKMKYRLRLHKVLRNLDTCVANTALLNVANTAPQCTISFSREFVERVGVVMPQGVSPYNPAYITVMLVDGWYHVGAHYLNRPDIYRLLWKTKDRPTWIPQELSNAKDDTAKARPRNLAAYRSYQARAAEDAAAFVPPDQTTRREGRDPSD